MRNSLSFNMLKEKNASLEKVSKELKESRSNLASARTERNTAELRARRVNNTAWVLGMVVGATLIVFVFTVYFIKKNDSKFIQRQNELITNKNREIIESIQYARKIQRAILPDLKLFKKIFPGAARIHMTSVYEFQMCSQISRSIIVIDPATTRSTPTMISLLSCTSINSSLKENSTRLFQFSINQTQVCFMYPSLASIIISTPK